MVTTVQRPEAAELLQLARLLLLVLQKAIGNQSSGWLPRIFAASCRCVMCFKSADGHPFKQSLMLYCVCIVRRVGRGVLNSMLGLTSLLMPEQACLFGSAAPNSCQYPPRAIGCGIFALITPGIARSCLFVT